MPVLALLSNNPFRLMGIYSNAPLKDLVANKNRLAAFARVGKKIAFPTDLSELLGEVPGRSTEAITDAVAKLDLPEDRLRHALFWFIKASPIDTAALSNLQTNNLAKTRNILQKKENFSSLLNLGVLALAEGDVSEAVDKITSVIHTDEYRESLVKEVCGEQFQISEEDLAKLFIDALCQEVTLAEIKEAFDSYGSSVDDDEYIRKKQIAQPVNHIKSEIATAKNCDSEDAEAHYQAGVRLLRNTRGDVENLRELLSSDDVDYELIINPLSEAILKCSIDYFDKTKDENDYEKALFLANYANSLATEEKLKTYCEKNIRIFNSKKEARNYLEETNEIKAASDKYLTKSPSVASASYFLAATKPALERLKAKAGADSLYYLNKSSYVAGNTVSLIVGALNSRQEKATFEDIRNGSLKSAFKDALDVLSSVSSLDMNSEAHEYFSTNRRIISETFAHVSELTKKANPNPLVELVGFAIRNWWIILVLIAVLLNL